ncbi:MAG: 30S ribosomal protein S4 [Verrucomicrobiae bacterium]|nr:30S ribosomal protein S4 [Verrucomicrobiae bacterium]
MARYTGPKQKISRRFNAPLFGPSKVLERKNYPPGMHGPKMRRKMSDYAVALAEKQKLRYQYGLLERQFRRIFENALRTRGVTGEKLLQLLETRVDNVVYRLGFAKSRTAARQLVGHGHLRVNGRRETIPSRNLRIGDVIEVRDNAITRQLVGKNLELTSNRPVPDWIALNREAMKGQVMRVPTREEIAPIVNEQLVVEFYSR